MRQNTSLTEGRVFPALLRFSIPFLLASFLQALYGAADLLIVGRFGDPAGVSAVATGSQFMQTITGSIIGLAAGGCILTGQYFGSRQKRRLADAAATVCFLFLLASFLLSFAMLLSVHKIAAAMQAPPEARVDTCAYLYICSFGIVFITGYNCLAAILRGMGDSKTPLLFVAAACLANIAGDLVLVAVFHLGARGAALATVLAQALSMLLACLYLLKKGVLRQFLRSRPAIRLKEGLSALKLGLPIALQEALINISFLLITAITNRMGVTASAAVGVVEKLIVFSMLPVTAVASAVAAMTAQNRGAGRNDRALSCMYSGVFVSLIPSAACFLAASLVPSALTALFTSDPGVIFVGAQYLKSYCIDCLMVCVVFCANAFFSGCGHSLFPLLHSLAATFLVRVPLAWYFSLPPHCSMFSIGLAAPLASFCSIVLCMFYLHSGRWERPSGD